MIENNINMAGDNNDNTILSLPIRKKDLGEFIYSLLGQNQSIERILEEPFDIDHSWLINIHQLLNQRIHTQANANLVSYKCIILFSDGMKRTFTTVESFEHYAETKKHKTIGIKIIWNYLIQFPNKEVPEKQQITFSAQIHPEKQNAPLRKKINKIIDPISLFKKRSTIQRSIIHYQIYHTERTWGDDIETILSSQVDDIVRTTTILDNVYELLRNLLVIVILLGGMYFSISIVNSDTNNKIINAVNEFKESFQDKIPSSEVISNKIDSLAELIKVIVVKDENIWLFLLSLVATAVIMTIFIEFTEKKIHSFLVLSVQGKVYRAKILHKENKRNIILVLSYLFSIIAGVLGNFGYSWLVQ